jgi:hypothetical protein
MEVFGDVAIYDMSLVSLKEMGNLRVFDIESLATIK